MYVMKKLNCEKRAFTEERKKKLEAQGYVCIKNVLNQNPEYAVAEDGAGTGQEVKDNAGVRTPEPEKKDEKKKSGGKASSDKTPNETKMPEGEGGSNGDTGKD